MPTTHAGVAVYGRKRAFTAAEVAKHAEEEKGKKKPFTG